MQIYINIFDNLLLNRDFMLFIVLTNKKENILSFKETKQKKKRIFTLYFFKDI